MAFDHKPRILFIYGSLRERSYSRLLAEEVVRISKVDDFTDRYSERKVTAAKQLEETAKKALT
ncbi:hypothetical protein [Leptolyngbya ectocarpi]|uniref:hypothetical protein n=1 Tax=Leptolyngbya ectocarpi TaxID=1202 RepID=UPI001D13E0B7